MVKLSDFASIYLLTSKMCCNLLKGIATCFFVKITRILFYGLGSTTRLSLQIGLSVCIIRDDRRGAPSILCIH